MTQSLLDLSRCYQSPMESCRRDLHKRDPNLYRLLSQELTNCQTSCSSLMKEFVEKRPFESCIEVEQKASYCFYKCVLNTEKRKGCNS